MKTLAIALAALLTAIRLQAHDLVLIPRADDTLVIKFGHPGEYEPADLHRLFELEAFAPGSDKPVSLLESKPFKAEPDWLVKLQRTAALDAVGLVAGQYDNGYWSEVAANRYFNASRLSVPNAKESGHYLKCGKGLALAGRADFQRVVGHRIELVPQVDPFTLKPGDSLPVLVLFEGKPLPGEGVEIGDGETKMKEEDIPRFKTDANGVAQLPLRKAGLQIIATDHKADSLHPDLADHDVYSAAFCFELRP